MAPIYLIVGAPGSGKSSAAHALAARSARGLHINVDHLRDMVVAGAVHPGGDWSPALVEQLQLARTTAVEMALRYQAVGFTVAIDDFWDAHSRLAEYAPLANRPAVVRAILFPAEEQVHAQLLRRGGSHEAIAWFLPGVGEIYAALRADAAALAAAGWHVLDSTGLSIEQTAARLLALETLAAEDR